MTRVNIWDARRGRWRLLAAAAAVASVALVSACAQPSATSTADPVAASLAAGSAAPPSSAADVVAPHPSTIARPSVTAHPTPRPTVAASAPATRKPATAAPPVTHAVATTAVPIAKVDRLPFPVGVTVGNATQVITVKAAGTWATVTAWTLGPQGWTAGLSTNEGRVGANGIVAGLARHQGTDTTPTGTYSLTQAFGIKPNPGSALPYHQVTNDDWWVEDNNSAYYNQMRGASQGGFDVNAPENSVNGSEHLIAHVGQYDYAVVVNYNMNPAVRYRGAGIFLHESDGHPTAGCVAVPAADIIAILQWLRPSAHPVIAIG